MVPQISVRPADDLYVVTFLYYMLFKFSSSSAFYCTYYRLNFVFTLCSGEVIMENFVHRGLPIIFDFSAAYCWSSSRDGVDWLWKLMLFLLHQRVRNFSKYCWANLNKLIIVHVRLG